FSVARKLPRIFRATLENRGTSVCFRKRRKPLAHACKWGGTSLYFLKIKGFSAFQPPSRWASSKRDNAGSSPAGGKPISCKDLHTVDRTCHKPWFAKACGVSGES